MFRSSDPRRGFRFRSCATACTAALMALGLSTAQAQTNPSSVRAAPQRAAPAQPSPVAPAGLPSVQPSPGGLTSANPAGLPSPNPTNLASPGTPAGSPATPTPGADTSAVIQPGGATMGAAGGAPGPAQNVPSGPNPYSAQQLAQAFRAADANLNGELTRAEAQRLTIMPASFEEMDRNKDGILSRSEFEDGVR